MQVQAHYLIDVRPIDPAQLPETLAALTARFPDADVVEIRGDAVHIECTAETEL